MSISINATKTYATSGKSITLPTCTIGSFNTFQENIADKAYAAERSPGD